MKYFVSYVYYETPSAIYNLEYFIKVGVKDLPDRLFFIVINGHTCSADIDNIISKYNNVHIIRRDNIGFCFGGHAVAIEHADKLYGLNNFDRFIFMNSGVIGPFLPSYCKEDDWPLLLTNKINEKVKLISTCITCKHTSITCETFCFALETNSVFVQNDDFSGCVATEDQLYKYILDAGYSIDCLLKRYEGIDWSDSINWNMQVNNFVSRANAYDGISIHPFETIFFKWYWKSPQLVSFDYVDKYRDWKLNPQSIDVEVYENGMWFKNKYDTHYWPVKSTDSIFGIYCKNNFVYDNMIASNNYFNVTNIIKDKIYDSILIIDDTLNNLFGDPCLHVPKALYLKIGDRNIMICEDNFNKEHQIVIDNIPNSNNIL